MKGLADICMVPGKREKVARLPQALAFIKQHCLVALRKGLFVIWIQVSADNFVNDAFEKFVCHQKQGGSDAGAARDAVACLRLVGKGILTSDDLQGFEFRKHISPTTDPALASEVGRLLWVRILLS